MRIVFAHLAFVYLLDLDVGKRGVVEESRIASVPYYGVRS